MIRKIYSGVCRHVIRILRCVKKLFEDFYRLLEKNRLAPNFDEDSVFLLTVAVIAVIVVDSDARAFAETVRAHSSKVTLIVLLGMGFSLYTAFFSSFKNEIQKFYMLWFAILVNFLCTIVGVIALMDSSASMWLYVFPALNVLLGLFLIIFWHLDILDTNAISGKSSSYTNTVYGGLFILAFVVVGEYFLSIPWPVILSLSVAYASVLTKFATGFLLPIFPSRSNTAESTSFLVEKGIQQQLIRLSEDHHDMVSICTAESEEDFLIPEKLLSEPDAFISDRIRDRSPGFSVASVGTYTVQKYWFLPARVKLAIIVDVYPQHSKGGHQFCQMLDYNEAGYLERHKGLIYLRKINKKS